MASAVGAVSIADGTLSAIAAADLSALQHTFVKLTADFTVNQAADETGCIGILQNKPTAGEVALVKIMGGSKMVAQGAITVGSFIVPATGGKGAATTTDLDIYGAIALEAAAADTEVISVLVTVGTLSDS